MKIDEFIEKVNKVAYAKKDGDCIYICDGETTSYQDYYFLAFLVTSKSMDLDWEWKHLRLIDAYKLRTILNLVKELQDTPVKDRFPKKHYRVRLRGFNSDGGHQYLTVSTRYSTINLGSVFAAAWNTGLKQTFTAEELNKIRERFKGSKWIVSMLNDGVEEVGK